MRTCLLGGVAILALAATAPAEDFWTSKPVREWTREETEQFLRNSPWVRQVVVTEAYSPTEARTFPPPAREAGREPTSREGVTFEPPPGSGSRLREAVYSVEWASAGIVRQAGMHLNALTTGVGEATEPAPLDVCILEVGGADLIAFDGRTDAQLKARAYLRPRALGAKVEPLEVRIQRDPNGRIEAVQFSFPRQLNGRPVITDLEKTVEFFCQAGELKLKTKFDVAKMLTPQGRDL